MSPFNNKLYLRKGGPEGAVVIAGSHEFHKTSEGMSVLGYSQDELCSRLKALGGLSDTLIASWKASGSLESTYDETAVGPKLVVQGKRPSQR